MKKFKSFTVRDGQTELVPWFRIDDFEELEFPRPIVLMNGAFDMLHSGHLKCFHHAAKAGRTVIVALDSDDKIKLSKGASRPILTFVERATSLQYMPIHGIVEIRTDADFNELVELLSPDLRVKGTEYQNASTRIPGVPTMWVRGDGMRTSKLVERILDRYK